MLQCIGEKNRNQIKAEWEWEKNTRLDCSQVHWLIWRKKTRERGISLFRAEVAEIWLKKANARARAYTHSALYQLIIGIKIRVIDDLRSRCTSHRPFAVDVSVFIINTYVHHGSTTITICSLQPSWTININLACSLLWTERERVRERRGQHGHAQLRTYAVFVKRYTHSHNVYDYWVLLGIIG